MRDGLKVLGRFGICMVLALVCMYFVFAGYTAMFVLIVFIVDSAEAIQVLATPFMSITSGLGLIYVSILIYVAIYH